jgi:hypothetical protein
MSKLVPPVDIIFQGRGLYSPAAECVGGQPRQEQAPVTYCRSRASKSPGTVHGAQRDSATGSIGNPHETHAPGEPQPLSERDAHWCDTCECSHVLMPHHQATPRGRPAGRHEQRAQVGQQPLCEPPESFGQYVGKRWIWIAEQLPAPARIQLKDFRLLSTTVQRDVNRE